MAGAARLRRDVIEGLCLPGCPRRQVDAIADTAAHEPVTVFCIHDADAAGSMISQSLQEATRARGRRRIEIIDIGLQPWDAVAKGLAIENVSYGKPQPVAAYIVAREDRRDWTQWLQNHRVELNAMTPGEMIRWLDENVEKHGNLKVVPPADVAVSALRDGIRHAIWDRERERILLAAEPEIRHAAEAGIAAAHLPSSRNLIADIRRKVQEQRNRHWTAVVTDAVRAAICPTDGEGAGVTAARPAISSVLSLRERLWDAGFRPLAVFNYDAPGPSPGKRPCGEAWQTQARWKSTCSGC